jgi:hypothetical protein
MLMNRRRHCFWLVLCIGASIACASNGAGDLDAGPLAQRFRLTLESGVREEILGPFYYAQQSDSVSQWALPPLLSYSYDSAVAASQFDLGYPILTYRQYGKEYRLQLLQILSFAGGHAQNEVPTHRFSLFPIFFRQHSPNTNQNYTAVLPFYGEIKNRFMRDDIQFIMFPLYVHTRKRDVVTDNYLFPIFHRRHGDSLSGWQFWPFVGMEHKGVTTRTNTIGEVETVGGHEKLFALWPVYFNDQTGIGTDNPQKVQAVLPLFSRLRSPQRDSTTYLWPLFTYTDDRGKKYHEWDAPWPLVVFARGEGKTVNRVWPLFSQAHNATTESDFYFWPLYKYNRVHGEDVARERTRILMFLYSDTIEKQTQSKAVRRRTDLWPLFSARKERDGSERLQLFALVEPFFPGNSAIEREYSQAWSIWRSEKNAKTGAASCSLLWNLYRQESAPNMKKRSFLFGLFQYQSNADGKRLRLFYIPIGKTKGKATPQEKA